jgi:hypothetical protein
MDKNLKNMILKRAIREMINEFDDSKQDVYLTNNQISYMKNILSKNQIKFKYELNILNSIEKQKGKISQKQKNILDRAVSGNKI